MTIKLDRAIELLGLTVNHTVEGSLEEWKEAVKLGNEALKRIKAKRLHFEVDIDRLLTGEAKEG